MRVRTFWSHRARRQWLSLRGLVVVSLVMVMTLFAGSTPVAQASDPVDAGYRDFSYGTPNGSCSSTPTGEKPESKLWWNDGFWWGSLCNDAAQEYHIYKFDLASQSGVDTGTVLDDRPGSKADSLWDDTTQRLYVASHIFTTNGQPSSSPSRWGRLYRYSYDSEAKWYGSTSCPS